MPTENAIDERGRRLGHLGFALPSLLLCYVDWRLALGIALYALFINAEVLPRTRIGHRWRRGGEGLGGGIVAFPLAVSLLVVLFRDDSLSAAAGWAAMGFGDPIAAAVGRRWPLVPLPWNPAKSCGGSLGFFLASVPALALLHAQHTGGSASSWLFALLVAAAAALLETLPLPVNDNLTVGLGAGLVASVCAGV